MNKIIDILFSQITINILLLIMSFIALFKFVDLTFEIDHNVKLIKEDLKELKIKINKENFIIIDGVKYRLIKENKNDQRH